MRLPFTDDLIVTTHYDGEMSMLADRHYSRRTPGARQFCYSGKKIVLRNSEGTVLFVWMFPNASMRMDSQVGYNCALFRNESTLLSSKLILRAERFALAKWGPGRVYTFVDSRKIRSVHPGYCFLQAGWWYVRGEDRKPLLTKRGKHILEKDLF